MISVGIGKRKYPELFYLKNILKKGDTCVDIGANLGYFSYFMSKHIGAEGKLISVEPISLFGDIWKNNMKRSKYNNYSLLQIALGENESEIKMGIPIIDGVLHHGMTKPINGKTDINILETRVKMMNPNLVFSGIEKIDFIKIDIEGFEYHVISNMTTFLQKHKPIVQSELSGDDNRQKVIDLFESLSYNTYVLLDFIIVPANTEIKNKHAGDFYFMPH